jgi:hypothetical protein
MVASKSSRVVNAFVTNLGLLASEDRSASVPPAVASDEIAAQSAMPRF